jgi:hypothetical protein
LGLNSWINPPSPQPTCFFVSNFLNLTIFVGENEKNCANSNEIVNNKKLAKKLAYKFEKKMLLLMDNNLKVINSNLKHINNFNINFI